VAQPKMEWWLNHVGQMAQSVQDYSITKYLYFLYKIYKEGELNTRCDMFLRYSEGDIPFVF